MSDRSGYMEIWVSSPDGSAAVQLTNLHECGTPRWSPDNLWIAFDGKGGGGSPAVWVVSSAGGAPRAVVKDQFENFVPSWSRDGKWLYFGSPRSGNDQVWKVPVDGGNPVQVTRGGGFAALESVDGATLYFAKSRYDNPELWQMPVAVAGKRLCPVPCARALGPRGVRQARDFLFAGRRLEWRNFD
jgi:Tol biopolymer transport system component